VGRGVKNNIKKKLILPGGGKKRIRKVPIRREEKKSKNGGLKGKKLSKNFIKKKPCGKGNQDEKDKIRTAGVKKKKKKNNKPPRR